ncbi:MAG: squalene synthase HpnC [Puniceicoccales bacterium]|jgi:phytoene synthase|nr:squalene synthase HpnC [Puniceicoccales bacterium]
MTLAESYARCERLAREHYENFPVARLLPRHLRPHVAAIYAFARTADDIADEGYGIASEDAASTKARLNALRRMDEQCLSAYAGEKPDPESAWIFLALGDTLRRFTIPPALCLDLSNAFAQDVTKRRYASFAELLDYCRRSANPVGRIVLLLHGYGDEQRFAMSDAICSALQLANFWQDVAVDWQKDKRLYLPLDDLARHGVSLETFDTRQATPALRECIRENVERAQALFDSGRPLAETLRWPLRLEIRATWLGGTGILQKIRAQSFDTLRSRPRIRALDKGRLLLRALFPLHGAGA